MAWEQRGRHRYYYQKSWVDGQVVSEYIGRGTLAHFAAWQDDVERDKREHARLEFAAFKREQRRMDRAIDDHHHAVKKFVAVVLRGAGFHQHKRQWRLKRGGEDRNMTDETQVAEGKRILEEFRQLLKAANAKRAKPAEIDRFRSYAEDHPDIFDEYPIFERITRQVVLGGSGMDEGSKIMVEGEMHALERSLGYETATPMEKLLIKDISLCWLRVQFFEQIYTKNDTGGTINMTRAAYLEKRLSVIRRRYLQSIESLAHVRGLLARAGVQINVAQQMVVRNG